MSRKETTKPRDRLSPNVRMILRFPAMLTMMLAVCGPAMSSAQTRPPTAKAEMTDSTIARLVTSAVIGKLGLPLSGVVLDSANVPWRVSVPDSTVPIWRRVQDGLEILLRARPVTPADVSTQFLEISLYPMRGDTLDFHFTIGERWRCYPLAATRRKYPLPPTPTTGWLESSYYVPRQAATRLGARGDVGIAGYRPDHSRRPRTLLTASAKER